MPALTAIYLDFVSLHSYRAWRWLSRLPERSAVDIRPYSLENGQAGEKRNPWDRDTSSRGLELLALGELARETGRKAHERYVDAAFMAVHDRGRDLSSPEAWLELVADVGLDLDAFTAHSDRWRAEVGLWHQEAEDDLGIFSVPTLVFEDTHALYVRLEEDVVDDEAARRLLTDLADLAVHPIDEIRRTA